MARRSRSFTASVDTPWSWFCAAANHHDDVQLTAQDTQPRPGPASPAGAIRVARVALGRNHIRCKR